MTAATTFSAKPEKTSSTGSVAERHLDLHLSRVRLMVQRHMRLRAERYLQADGSYSDLCVGPQELRKLLGYGDSAQAQQWLTQLGVLPLDEIERRLQLHEYALEKLLEEAMTEGSVTLLPIEELRAGFMLSAKEMDLFLVAAAPRLSVDIARLFTVAWVDFSIRQATAGFLAELVSPDRDDLKEALGLLANSGSLVQYRLLVPREHPMWTPGTPRVHSPIEVPQRLLDFLTGALLNRTTQLGCTLHSEGLTPDELVLNKDTRKLLHEGMRRPRPRMCLIGAERSGRRTVVCSLAVQAGTKLLEVDLSRALVMGGRSGVMTQLAELLREARLHNAAILLRLDRINDTSPLYELLRQHSPTLRALLQDYPGAVFVASTQGGKFISLLIGSLLEVRLTAPDNEGQYALWKRALVGRMGDVEIEANAEELSRNYRLTPGSVFRSVSDAVEQHGASNRRGRGKLPTTVLLRSVRRQLNHGLGWLADVISVSMSLNDIVLSAEMRAQIEEVFMYARHASRVFEEWGMNERTSSGRGLSVLFSGPPGTGKTMTAGVLARELGRVLYRVDLSRIVDKYIGETEKNLAKVFDEAERAQAVLLFDEADSLFAKRTAVKSSNDRYANLEVNFLLQRLDDYAGISILTTNFVTSIDEAFQRRIRFKIEFPMPAEEQRSELWKQLLPPNAPIAEDIVWGRLGESFEFSGGHIKNAILRAAVQAAQADSSITEDLLFDAALAEAREMGQLIFGGADPKKRRQKKRSNSR